MELLVALGFCILNLVSFVVGAKIGQKTAKGEKIEMPTVNPVALYHEHKEKEEAKKEMNKLDIILNNIERYDGTEAGQEDVPR
jgi:hypothetical protein